jgi:glycosyltransferase involved in cell wall biosynthesis
MNKKLLIWGAMPNENDGGAIVTYYQLQKMNEIDPEWEIHVAPKVWEQATPDLMPYLKWHQIRTRYFGQIPNEIPKIMKKHNIPLLVLWHVPWEYFPIIDKVHKIGGKVINWQTIHWANDVLFLSDKLQDFDWWIPPTNYALETLVKEGNLDRNKMTVIPHGVNLECFYPHDTRKLREDLGIKQDQKMVLFVGRCSLAKGIVPMMLTARKLCNNFDCHIVFKAGVHEGVAKAKEIAHLLHKMTKWDSRIHFLSQWTSPSFMEELTAASDILVCPSGHEGSSLPPLEMMACQKPVVITDIPVHRELLGGKNGKCGLLMPPMMRTEYVNDIQMVTVPTSDMIYGSVKYLLENPDESEVMGENGLNRAKEYYDLKKVCQKWFGLLEKLNNE